jgi:hypothetical protein
MAGTAKNAGLVVVAVLAVVVTGACGQSAKTVAVDDAPSVVSTPKTAKRVS